MEIFTLSELEYYKIKMDKGDYVNDNVSILMAHPLVHSVLEKFSKYNFDAAATAKALNKSAKFLGALPAFPLGLRDACVPVTLYLDYGRVVKTVYIDMLPVMPFLYCVEILDWNERKRVEIVRFCGKKGLERYLYKLRQSKDWHL